MDRQLILHKLIKEELHRCENLYEKLSAERAKLPKGSLLDRNGHIYRAFREDGRQYQKPIKEDEVLLNNLKLRRYLKKSMPDLAGRIRACKLFLENETFYDPAAAEAGLKPLYKGIVSSDLFLDEDISAELWTAEEYKRNDYPFSETHVTEGGLQVRSKAEAMIGTQMEHLGIMFRAEPQLELGNQYVYPDFEIFLPNIRRRVYIEHFGRMDDPEYLMKALYKIGNYHKAGLHLGVNFFFTWESREKPLNISEIHSVLEQILQLDTI